MIGPPIFCVHLLQVVGKLILFVRAATRLTVVFGLVQRIVLLNNCVVVLA